MDFRFPYSNVFSAFPDFVMALVFLVTWIEPDTLGKNMIGYLTLVMMMEFIIIHSSAFFGGVMFADRPKFKKLFTLLGLGLFYTVFVASFSAIYGEWWPLLAFWAMIVNRMLSILLGQFPEGDERMYMMGMWGIHVGFYVLLLFFAMFMPLPHFGITETIQKSFQSTRPFFWYDEPHRILAFGFLYFFAITVFEMKIKSWVKKVEPAQMPLFIKRKRNS
jgi:hypothetical protein